MRAPLSGTNLPLRGARSVRGGLAALAVVVVILSAALVAWPRATANILTSDLQYRAANASAPTRDLQSVVDADFGYAPGVGGAPGHTTSPTWQALPAALATIRTEMPATVRAITGPGRYVARDGGSGGRGVPASGPPKPPAGSAYVLTVEANPLLESDAVLVAGSWPSAAVNFPGKTPLQVVVAAKAATELHWSIGETQTLTTTEDTQQRIILVGTVRPRDPNSDYWQLDRTRSQAGVVTSPDGDHPNYNAVIWMNSRSWPSVGGEFPGPSIVSWYPVSGRGLTVDSVSPTIGDLQRFLSLPRQVGTGSTQAQLRFSTNLSSVANDFLARARPAAALLSVVATGPLGTGCAVLLLGIFLLIDGRRGVLLLIRARGATGRRLRTTVGIEVGLATVPAAIIGGAVGALLTPGSVSPLLILTVGACAILPAVAAAARVGADRGALSSGRPRRWRWIAETILALLTVLSVVLLLQRGLSPESATVGVDPLLTLIPLLIAATVCVGILRAYPFVLAWIGVILRRRRGAVGFVGWSTAAQTPSSFLPMFAVIAGVSITIFSLTVVSTERAGIRDAALSRVGADVSVSAEPLDLRAAGRLAEVPGVATVATIDTVGGASVQGVDDDIALFTVDARQLITVQSALPSSLQQFAKLGSSVHGRSTAIGGGFPSRLPAAASLDVSPAPAIPVHLLALTGPTPTFVSDPPWILMDRAALPARLASTLEPLVILLGVRPGSDTPATLAAIRRIVGPDATILDTQQLVAAAKTAPVVTGFEQLTEAALALSALMSVTALLLTLLLNTPARARLLGRLRALGFTRRQSSGLIGWELGPLVAFGAIIGLALGLTLPLMILASIDLAGFTGSVSDPPVVAEPLAVAAIIGALIVAGALSTTAAIIWARRANVATVLRSSGED